MSGYDCVVVGAGMAGLRAAEVLAAHQREVLTIEKEERPGRKVCADGLSRRSLALGLIPPEFHQKEFRSILLRKGGRETLLRSQEPLVTIFDRVGYSGWMMDRAADRGAGFRLGSEIVDLDLKERSITDRSGEVTRFTHLIGADGARSLVRSALGAAREVHGLLSIPASRGA